MVTEPAKRSRFISVLFGRRNFLKDEDGTSTVEAVLWIPVFLAIFLTCADIAMLFNARSMMLKTIEDANRAYSVGELASLADVEAWVIEQTSRASDDVRVSSTVEVADIPSGIVRTVLTIPASDLAAVGWVTALADFDVRIGSQQYVEF